LGASDSRQQHPDEGFTQAQAALAGGGKPELEFGGTEDDDVTVPKNRGLNGFAVDGGQGVGAVASVKPFCRLNSSVRC